MGAWGWIAIIAGECFLLTLLIWGFLRLQTVQARISDGRPVWLAQVRAHATELRKTRRRLEKMEGQVFSLESVGGVGPKWIGIRLLLKALVRAGAQARS